jgi:chemotaxis protein MotB
VPRARRRAPDEAIEEPSKAWLDSYADAMTLLLAFFILLYASSLIDERKFFDFKVGMAEALGNPTPVIDQSSGILDGGDGVTSQLITPDAGSTPREEQSAAEEGAEADDPLAGVNDITPENAQDLVDKLQQRVDELGVADYVEIINDPKGVIVRFDSQVLFRSGAAQILPDGVIVLGAVAEALASIDNLLVVEGHTDNVPTDGSEWPSNWELSATRATTVLRYLTDLGSVPEARVSAAGYAATRPQASNATPEGRARNRRVEIVVVVAPMNEQVATTGGLAAGDLPGAAPPDLAPGPVDVFDPDPGTG